VLGSSSAAIGSAASPQPAGVAQRRESESSAGGGWLRWLWPVSHSRRGSVQDRSASSEFECGTRDVGDSHPCAGQQLLRRALRGS
jgi:hypothetical protein